MRTVPENNFAVVRDRERRMIVHAGTFTECLDTADRYNLVYQSTAYVVEAWADHCSTAPDHTNGSSA